MAATHQSIVIRLVIAQICVHGTMSGLRMAAPLLALRVGYDAMSVGLLLALFGVAQLFLALPIGRYADRHGSRKPIVMAASVSAISLLVLGIWPVFEVACFAAVMNGAAAGTAMISVQRHAGQLSTDHHEMKKIFSWIAVAPTLSNFFGPLLAGVLIDAFDFQITFLVLCGVPPIAVIALRGLTEPAQRPRPAEDQLYRGSPFALLKSSALRRLLIVNLAISAGWDVLSFMLPLRGHDLGLSASAIGMVLASVAIAATASRLMMPWVFRRAHDMWIVYVSMVITGVLFCLVPLASSAIWLGYLAALLGAFLGSVQPLIMSVLHKMTPPQRQGEALGLRTMSIYLSSITIPILSGTIGAAVGTVAVFLLVGAVIGATSRVARSLID